MVTGTDAGEREDSMAKDNSELIDVNSDENDRVISLLNDSGVIYDILQRLDIETEENES